MHFFEQFKAVLLRHRQESPLPEGCTDRFRAELCAAQIAGCIAMGKQTRGEIVATIGRSYDFTHRFAGFMLGRFSGTDPARHLWHKDTSGRYQLLSSEPAHRGGLWQRFRHAIWLHGAFWPTLNGKSRNK